MSILRIVSIGLLVAGNLVAEPQKRKIQLRSVLHNPRNPLAELYIPDSSGGLEQLKFKPKDLSAPVQATVIDGSILLYSSPEINEENPAENLVGKAKVPTNIKSAILLIFPGTKGATGSKRFPTMVIDGSAKAFPFGSALLINGTSSEVAVLAGEHRVGAKPGVVRKIPPITKVNDFNLAQNNFYYRASSTEAWKPFVERQLKFINKQRRIFIVHRTTGAAFPEVATIVDLRPRPSATSAAETSP